MKKYIFLFFALVCFVALQGQTSDVAITTDTATAIAETVNYSVAATGSPSQDIEKTIVDHFVQAVKDFLGYVDWLFMVVFIVITWLINGAVCDKNKFGWLDWMQKIPRLLIALGIGLILTVAFYYLFDYSGIIGIRTMLMSLLLSMVVYKIGIDKFLKWIFGKIGIKFSETMPENKINNHPPTQTEL